MSWIFPSKAFGEYEGFGNGNLEMFKGDPLKALAREICQNSLDACADESRPVEVEFILHTVKTGSFPGMHQLDDILDMCDDFWKKDKNAKIHSFLRDAKDTLSEPNLKVLRISDYNTKGLRGAYATDEMTPWIGLVKASAVSVKNDTNAAGSYGIGKSAPFVNSYLQTVFYRTLDDANHQKAVQGVARLMAFRDESYGDPDPIRRSVGYYGDGETNMPLESIPELDLMNARTQCGTDLFVPGFKVEDQWIDRMIGEIIENFLVSLCNGKLVVRIGADKYEPITLDKNNVSQIIARYRKYIKDGYDFNCVLRAPKEEVAEEIYDFHGMGTLRLKVLYKTDLNQKILVVRNSGMKIADIPKLPRIIPFSGVLQLEGDELNAFFREMETPQHNSWEPKRHSTDPIKAKAYKEELELWVKKIIDQKVLESVGDEADIDTVQFFSDGDVDEENKVENIHNEPEKPYFQFQQKVNRTYKKPGAAGGRVTTGTTGTGGSNTGYRTPTGGSGNGGQRKGRDGSVDPSGNDKVHTGMRKVQYNARVIKEGKGKNRLIIQPFAGLKDAQIEIITMGENGKSLALNVLNVSCADKAATCKDGKIYIDRLEPDTKIVLEFELGTTTNFALGVNVYGNKE